MRFLAEDGQGHRISRVPVRQMPASSKEPQCQCPVQWSQTETSWTGLHIDFAGASLQTSEVTSSPPTQPSSISPTLFIRFLQNS
ncbi:unnamed protein product [Hymenolepis diminuta]|uniref:Uncharacterized protein n=1 Tax=Hymenolepis diminuta TaxID=6216 RepID=A0A564YAE6_HYMDI|nr:unnamed protein product [Hymenolepis diminuta]